MMEAGGVGARRARVEIYTCQYCSYSLAAKRLLQHKKVDYIEYAIDGVEDARDLMSERAGGRRTVPQIFINGRHIGGYTNLAGLVKGGELDTLLAAEA